MKTFLTNNKDYPELQEVTFVVGDMEMTIIPNANMVISSIRRHGVELLAQKGGLKDYKEKLSSFAAPFMAPWINRMSTTEYDFDGKHYSFDKTNLKKDDNGYPMHGLLTATSGWKFKTAELYNGLSISGSFNYDEKVHGFESFPFPHKIGLIYTLTPTRIIVETTIYNYNHFPIPIAFGFHPHFELATNINVYGADRQILLNSHTLPVTAETFNPKDTDPTVEMYKMMNNWHADMKTAAGNIKITTENYPYMLLWRPTGESYAALEPMTSNIDPMNQNPTITPARTPYKASYTISF